MTHYAAYFNHYKITSDGKYVLAAMLPKGWYTEEAKAEAAYTELINDWESGNIDKIHLNIGGNPSMSDAIANQFLITATLTPAQFKIKLPGVGIAVMLTDFELSKDLLYTEGDLVTPCILTNFIPDLNKNLRKDARISKVTWTYQLGVRPRPVMRENLVATRSSWLRVSYKAEGTEKQSRVVLLDVSLSYETIM